MKNIHLLPTDKPSRLFKFANQLHLDTIPKDYYKKYNIYITSDEDIKEGELKKGDWYYSPIHNKIFQCIHNNEVFELERKIILTTDQDLIADGVQSIDDDFLEWFVNNPSCESVVVNFNYKKFRWSELNKSQCYKIIIPKEEPKQETLEEAAYRLSAEKFEPNHIGFMLGVIEGAKLQAERMYSEEEVRKIAEEVRWQAIGNPLEFTKNFEKWFEQFKKK